MDAARPPAHVGQPSDLLEQASGPVEGADSLAGSEDDQARLGRWLSRALQAERAAVVGLLEARHDALVQQLERGGWSGPDALARSAPAGDRRDNPHAKLAWAAPGAQPLEAAPGAQPNPETPVLAAWGLAGHQGRSVSVVPSPGSDTAPRRAASPQSPLGSVAQATAADTTPLQRASASEVRRRSSQMSTHVRSIFHRRQELRSPVGRLVTSTGFEAVGASAVVLLAFCMALESQYAGLEVGFQLGYGTYARPAARTWPWAASLLDVMNWALGLTFCVELVLKLIGLGFWDTFKEVWSIFDAAITMLWLLEVGPLNGLIHADVLLLRVIRIFRLVRFVRLVKTFRMLDSLYLIYTALIGSLSALGWAIVILFLAQVLMAFFLTEILSLSYFHESTEDVEKRKEVFQYFGTWSRAVLSTFEMTLANWPTPCRVLVEHVSEWFALLCLAHKLVVGFAVVGIINGVFIQETFRCANDDDQVIIHQKERATATHVRKMQKLFEAADYDRNGVLDRQEFKRVLQHDDVKMWLTAMDYDLEDTDVFFDMLDNNGSNTVTPEEFVRGITRLRGGAKSVDVKRLIAWNGQGVTGTTSASINASRGWWRSEKTEGEK